MAELTDSLFRELISIYGLKHPREGNVEASPMEVLRILYLKFNDITEAEEEWEILTSKEKRIFQSPLNFFNVVNQWHSPSKQYSKNF